MMEIIVIMVLVVWKTKKYRKMLLTSVMKKRLLQLNKKVIIQKILSSISKKKNSVNFEGLSKNSLLSFKICSSFISLLLTQYWVLIFLTINYYILCGRSLEEEVKVEVDGKFNVEFRIHILYRYGFFGFFWRLFISLGFFATETWNNSSTFVSNNALQEDP